MQFYRVTGAERESGKDFDEVLLALNEADAIEQANRRGILVSRLQPIAAPPTIPPHSKSQGSVHRWRYFLRATVWAGSSGCLILGALTLLGALIDFANADSILHDRFERELHGLAGAIGLHFGFAQLLFGGLGQLLLYVEDHLAHIRRKT